MSTRWSVGSKNGVHTNGWNFETKECCRRHGAQKWHLMKMYAYKLMLFLNYVSRSCIARWRENGRRQPAISFCFVTWYICVSALHIPSIFSFLFFLIEKVSCHVKGDWTVTKLFVWRRQRFHAVIDVQAAPSKIKMKRSSFQNVKTMETISWGSEQENGKHCKRTHWHANELILPQNIFCVVAFAFAAQR